MKKFLAIVLAAMMLVSLAACGSKPAAATNAAETYPTKDISIICPFKAGGGMDLSTRLTAQYLEKALGVTVTVNNVEGGNSWTGWSQVAEAAGDGYVLGFANFPAQVTGYMNPSAGVPYTYKDFTYLANVVHDANVLFVSEKYCPYKTLAEFMEAGKTRDDMVLGTGGGLGCDDDIIIAKINKAFGTKFISGLNASTAEERTAVMGGNLIGGIANVSEMYTYINNPDKDTNIIILAVWDKQRDAFMPDCPTAEEQGFGGIYGASDRGLCATAKLDPAIAAKLIETVKGFNNDPEFFKTAESQGLGIGFMYGDEFTNYVKGIEDTVKEIGIYG